MLSDQQGDTDIFNGCHFWSNFDIGSLNFWSRSTVVRQTHKCASQFLPNGVRLNSRSDGSVKPSGLAGQLAEDRCWVA
ncbi:hypothetical protein BGZ82_010768 [Podila clonocystis]|nr:hypothetical protein BGZ82_010768 [Podila clonocystis]